MKDNDSTETLIMLAIAGGIAAGGYAIFSRARDIQRQAAERARARTLAIKRARSQRHNLVSLETMTVEDLDLFEGQGPQSGIIRTCEKCLKPNFASWYNSKLIAYGRHPECTHFEFTCPEEDCGHRTITADDDILDAALEYYYKPCLPDEYADDDVRARLRDHVGPTAVQLEVRELADLLRLDKQASAPRFS